MTLKIRTIDSEGQKRHPELVSQGWTPVIGSMIYMAQQELTRHGFEVKMDGAFGQDTENAVKRFQESNDIVVTGEIDEVFWNQMKIAVPSLADKLIKAINTLATSDIYTPGETFIVGVGYNRRNVFHTNHYDDRIYVLFNNEMSEYKCTVDPGVDIGSWQLASQQQILYVKGYHHKDKFGENSHCLRPHPDSQMRFMNNSFVGFKACNIHWGGQEDLLVKNWSEGCQVIANGYNGYMYQDFLAKTWNNKNQETFLYTLIDLEYLQSIG